jgi:hypothetical protein
MSDGSFWTAFGTLTMAVMLVVILYRLMDAITDPPAKWLARKLVNWKMRGHPKWGGTFTTDATIVINGKVIPPGTYRASGNLTIDLSSASPTTTITGE